MSLHPAVRGIAGPRPEASLAERQVRSDGKVVRGVPTAVVEVGEDAEPVDADVGALDEDVVEPLAGLGASKS